MHNTLADQHAVKGVPVIGRKPFEVKGRLFLKGKGVVKFRFFEPLRRKVFYDTMKKLSWHLERSPPVEDPVFSGIGRPAFHIQQSGRLLKRLANSHRDET